MGQCSFINCNKCTTLEKTINWWERGIWQFFVLSTQFCREPKNTNIKLFFEDFIYIFLEREEGREKERERNMDVREKHRSVAS